MKNQIQNTITPTYVADSITKELKRSTILFIIESILTIIFGVLAVIDPVSTLSIISWILGIFLIVTGIYTLVMYFVNSSRTLFDNSLLRGVILTIFGIILLTSTLEIFVIFGIIVGIWIIYDSITRLNISLNLRSAGVKAWPMLLLISILMLVLGCILVFVPFSAYVIAGWVIVISGVISLVGDILFIANLKKITSSLKSMFENR